MIKWLMQPPPPDRLNELFEGIDVARSALVRLAREHGSLTELEFLEARRRIGEVTSLLAAVYHYSVLGAERVEHDDAIRQAS